MDEEEGIITSVLNGIAPWRYEVMMNRDGTTAEYKEEYLSKNLEENYNDQVVINEMEAAGGTQGNDKFDLLDELIKRIPDQDVNQNEKFFNRDRVYSQ